MKTLDPIVLRSSAERHGLSLVVLFGSASKGAPRPADLDLAVMPENPSSSGFLQLARAWPREFGRGDLDLAWLPTASAALWQEVLYTELEKSLPLWSGYLESVQARLGNM